MTHVSTPAPRWQQSRPLPIPAGRLVGGGIDLLDVDRFARLASRSGPALERRLCTEAESRSLPGDPGARLLALAGLFSVKESVIKALGGLCAGGRFTDICTAGVPAASSPSGLLDDVALTGATAAMATGRRLNVLAHVEPVAAGGDAEPALLSWAFAVGAAAPEPA